ncbi:40S ribosomal protein S27 [Pleurotus ostreatus]|uniref:40S ribosomal protein S27 n=1 Tax=Pleurotus ostreatus TaxID=5322 RepID=A0A8H6ZZB8_PLEOS|nr:40S ribosomal protein S27 [Pleurotus ostreatus]KAF7437098.1 40S ribosomal protein S27 [Pleurotus ostreatus]
MVTVPLRLRWRGLNSICAYSSRKYTNTKNPQASPSHIVLVATKQWQPLAIDLLNPSADYERKQHKLKRLVQSPNSYFMDVKCSGCFAITTVFSHAQTVVLCGSCSSVLCQPTGGKARLTEGSSYRRKN